MDCHDILYRRSPEDGPLGPPMKFISGLISEHWDILSTEKDFFMEIIAMQEKFNLSKQKSILSPINLLCVG